MSQIPEHYSLVKEHDDHFEIHDARDDKKFKIHKKSIHPATQIKLMKMQKFAEGGDVEMEGYDTGLSGRGAESSPAPQAEDSKPSGEAEPSGFFGNWLAPDAGQVFDRSTPYQTQQLQDTSAPASAAPLPAQAPAALPTPETPTPLLQAQPDMAPPSGGGHPGGALPPASPSTGGGPEAYMPTPEGYQRAIGGYGNAVMQEAKGLQAQNQQKAQALSQHMLLEEDRVNHYNQSIQRMQDQYNQLYEQTLNSKIDPDRIWATRGAGSKATAAISMILGGLAQGLMKSQTNPGVDMINKLIDRDIEAQKLEIGKKQNLLSHNLAAQGNMMQAESVSRLQMQAMLEARMMKIAAQTSNPIIEAQAKQKITEMRMQAMPIMSQLANNQWTMEIKKRLTDPRSDLSQMDPSQFVPHVVPEAHQKEVFQEIKDAQNANRLEPEIIKAFKEAQGEQTMIRRMGGVLGDSPAVKRLKVLMLPFFENIDGTVRQAAMEEAYHDHIPGMGDWDSTGQSKLSGLQSWLHAKKAAPMAKGYGIDLNKFSSTSTDPVMRLGPQERLWVEWARKNPGDRRAQAVMQQLGVQ